MFSKLLAYFMPNIFENIEVVRAQTVSVGNNDFLVITVSPNISPTVHRKFSQSAKQFFRSENVLVVAGDDVRVLKVAIEDRMADEIMLKEEVSKWKN